ncbi:uncharacterized protein Z520_08992 [Fonsecaea multimorphosa CBS 102226]|uniref:UDP-N-acetylglucosamine transferase subunit ALG14 n=1 Tax=Fonsecaea multimorphosa CBS 102226 TaxID=1442371 RepID=A0A0D2H0Y7_9EURO|nr:uncharacterized protein Z520_08992 [Fonsecaea multimorphosa CBS 102226]KIX95475.1 hypothetical protein Z520_08992 [Fonsecaea multimorphosa CBS 102226]
MKAHQTPLKQPQGSFPGGTIIWITMFTPLITLSPIQQPLLFIFAGLLILLCLSFFRLVQVLRRQPVSRRPPPSSRNPTHLLVVLGSGGHTAEMLNILNQYRRLQLDFTKRTYVVSSGDDFSTSKARDFEAEMLSNLSSSSLVPEDAALNYSVVTVHRARRVHQSLLTTPVTSLRCLWDCLNVLRGTHRDFKSQPGGKAPPSYPDLILTNGPGTGVIVFLASIILLFFGLSSPSTAGSEAEFTQSGQMRTIFIESWARVKTLSLSGRLLKPFVHRFLVQWPQLAAQQQGKAKNVEFVGSLVT